MYCRYWRTREQRAHTGSPGGPKGKGQAAEDQEQQDPMEFGDSDEENGEEDAVEEEKPGGHGGAAKRCLQEQRERLHGALALIELANNLSAWALARATLSLALDPRLPSLLLSVLSRSPVLPSCIVCAVGATDVPVQVFYVGSKQTWGVKEKKKKWTGLFYTLSE